MRRQGDAESVGSDAQQRLDKDPEDDDARIFLALSLLARQRQPEAEDLLRQIDWAALPERKGRAPRMMFAWP